MRISICLSGNAAPNWVCSTVGVMATVTLQRVAKVEGVLSLSRNGSPFCFFPWFHLDSLPSFGIGQCLRRFFFFFFLLRISFLLCYEIYCEGLFLLVGSWRRHRGNGLGISSSISGGASGAKPTWSWASATGWKLSTISSISSPWMMSICCCCCCL